MCCGVIDASILTEIIKNWTIVQSNSRDFIGLAAIEYEPLYHAREIATIKLSSTCSCKVKSARSSNNSIVFNKKIIPLTLVGYEMIITNSTLRASWLSIIPYPTRARGIIGHFHDGVILLQLPEFISISFSNSDFVIPVDSKEQ